MNFILRRSVLVLQRSLLLKLVRNKTKDEKAIKSDAFFVALESFFSTPISRKFSVLSFFNADGGCFFNLGTCR
jgi:hypothetical protein